jgi:ribosomal protein L1
MNLGPGMPKTSKDHKLKGVFIFPHGLGKKPLKVAAITSDPDLAIAAYQAGARYAGDLGDSIRRGFVPLRALDRLVATDEMIEVLNRRDNRVAKKLHKYKMTPNYTSKTLCKPEDFVDSVKAHVNGRYHKFVISSRGLIICPVGTITGSTPEQVRMNVEYVLRYLVR